MLSQLLIALCGLSLAHAAAVHRQAYATMHRTIACNGNEALCNRVYSNVTHIGAHDSYAVDPDPLNLSANQNIAITDQLNMGVRLLQSQAHLKGSTLELCHTNCILYDGGSLLSYLTTVKQWLDANPNEVVTLVVTNGDNISVKQYWVPAFTASGIVPYAYIPSSPGPGRNNWPTLGTMISSNKRLVVFMDYNSDTASAPYILPEFSNIWETKYDVTDKTFPCSVDRGTASGMLMINHFLDMSLFGIPVPDRGAAPTTNSVTSILANANGCANLNSGLFPTFVLLDFVDQGQSIQAGKLLNGIA